MMPSSPGCTYLSLTLRHCLAFSDWRAHRLPDDVCLTFYLYPRIRKEDWPHGTYQIKQEAVPFETASCCYM